jgi:hypothetical protein
MRKWWWAILIAFGFASTLAACVRRRAAPAPRIRRSLPENAEPDAPLHAARTTTHD